MARSIHAFDLDHTLFKGNSSYCFGRYLYQQKYFPYSDWLFILFASLRFKVGLLPIERLHHDAFARLFSGRSQLEIDQMAERFLKICFEGMVYLPALKRLEQVQQEGHLTVLLSSSPDFLVSKIAKRFNIPVCHGTQYAVDKDRRFCHISHLILGTEKAQILENLGRQYGIAKRDTFAYSDSHLDLPFLLSAGSAIGVNPNRKLRTLCRQNQWPIIT